MPTTTENLDRLIDNVFDSEKKILDAFGKAYARLPEQLRTAKLPMADKLMDPVTFVNKSYAVAEKVLGDTETGKLVARQKEIATSFAEYFAPHFAA
jgi:hypothetical protein